MAKRIFSSENYISVDNDNGSAIKYYKKSSSVFRNRQLSFFIQDLEKGSGYNLEILKADVATWFAEDGTTAYSEATLLSFLLTNTGFNLAGGSSALPTTGDLVFITQKSDFPSPVGGVITLEAEKTYWILGDIDLTGDRLVGSQDTVILGSSSENSSLTSTGIGSDYLFTTNFTTPIRHITFADVTNAVAINPSNTGAQPIALDWYGVNFNNTKTSCLFGDIDNFILTVGAILNGGSFEFIGSVGTIGINSSIFVGDGSAGPLIQVAASATVTRRFRVIYSAFVAFGQTEAIDVEALATVPTEAFILDTCNFSGGGTYLPSLDHTSNKTLFSNNVGIVNSQDVSQYYMNGNTTATTITTQGVAVKIEGVTTSGSITEKFTNTNNRATYNGVIQRPFKIVATLSAESGNNNQIGIYVAKNGVLIPESEVYGTTSGSGRAENIVVQAFVEMVETDYIEIWVENDTGVQNIVVTDLNVIVE